jgi:hypothetical protein
LVGLEVVISIYIGYLDYLTPQEFEQLKLEKAM